MAQATFRLNVSAAQFPFLSDQLGTTVIVSQQDTYYVRPNQFTGETADRNIGIPQFTFIENVMPTSYGIQSIGYSLRTATFNPLPFLPSVTGDQLLYLRSQNGRRYLLNFDRRSGQGYVFSPEVNKWLQIINLPADQGQAYVAFVKGRCFLFIANGAAVFEFKGFNSFSESFEFLTITSFVGISDFTTIDGITSANNYLILFTKTIIFYAIPSDVLWSLIDFTPSLSTGAASETPSVLRGVILTMLPTQDGFYAFTSTNIFAAYYSGNIRFPWSYRELENSAAINTLDDIATDRDGYPKYAYTSAGLLKIRKSNCAPIFPEASEFIGNTVYETFDWDNKEIKKHLTINPLHTSLAWVAGRWLVISYGTPDTFLFSHAIIWDDRLKRWGKIQVDHARAVEFFEQVSTFTSTSAATYQNILDLTATYQDLLDQGTTYAQLGGDVRESPDVALEYKSLGFLQQDGIIQLVNFDADETANNSIAILSRVQLTRSSRSKIVSVWLEQINDSESEQISFPKGSSVTYQNLLDAGWTYQQLLDLGFTYESITTSYSEGTKLAILSSNDTRNTAVIDYGIRRIAAPGGIRKFQYAHAEGINHQLRFEGDFKLSSIVVVSKRTGSAYL